MITFAWILFGLAALPVVMTLVNHIAFSRPPRAAEEEPEISILIPARDEAANIRSAVEAALAAEAATVEVVVLDDHSTDGTDEIVREMAAADPRVRLESAPELPAGWCGKQHACARLAEHARYPLMQFVDADVTMSPEAPARLAAFLQKRKAGLVSAFPQQVTGTFLEKLLIPLIEYVLLAYLPIPMSRLSLNPGFGAGCGQVFLADKAAYEKVGGHTAIKASLHDGVKLPRAFRQAGYQTDICSGVGLIRCRMYHSAREVWSGLLKNAHEGIASPGNIVPFTVLLLGGAVLPVLLCWLGPWQLVVAAVLAMLPRLLNTLRFRQSLLGWLLHPVAVLLFLVIQWQAFGRQRRGVKPAWKGRAVG